MKAKRRDDKAIVDNTVSLELFAQAQHELQLARHETLVARDLQLKAELELNKLRSMVDRHIKAATEQLEFERDDWRSRGKALVLELGRAKGDAICLREEIALLKETLDAIRLSGGRRKRDS